MERLWLANYPAGVPSEIDTRKYSSLVDLCDEACLRYRGNRAFGNIGTFLTFAEIDRHARDFAAYLQTTVKIKPGDRVALMMPNILQYPIALLGVLRAGGIVVNTNPEYTPRELRHQLKDSGAKTIVILENVLHVLADTIDDTAVDTIIVTRLGEMMPFPKSFMFNFIGRRAFGKSDVPSLANTVGYKDVLQRGSRQQLEPVELSHDDLAFLQYTGGTTGVAKGAMLSHGNVIANVLQVAAWFNENVTPGREIVITALPLYHIYALTVNCFSFMYQGAMNYLITNPRDLDHFIKELKRVRFTAITGVNTLFKLLAMHEEFSTVDFSGLKYSNGGGMAIQKSVAERWQSLTQCVLSEGYGLTEASPVVCINRFDADHFTGCIGLPVPSTECCIRDDDGRTLGINEPGELCVRGPQVMQGYWQRPEAAASVFTKDGWLKTGDIAIMREDGYFKIVDRKKDMIVVSGFNVYPNEIEEVVASHPGVSEVAAIGVADPKTTEAVKIVVVRSDPTTTEQDILEHCRRELTGYKRPKIIVFAEELPKTNVGKILRRSVRELYGQQA